MSLYSPLIPICIISVDNSSSTTPATTRTKTVPKTKMVPVYESRFVPTGSGRGYWAPSTRYNYITDYETTREYVPASTTYFVQIKYTVDESIPLNIKTWNLMCLSNSRQTELVEYFKKNKQINIRYILGVPVIPDIKYNWWLENPFTLVPLIAIPTIIVGFISMKIFG